MPTAQMTDVVKVSKAVKREMTKTLAVSVRAAEEKILEMTQTDWISFPREPETFWCRYCGAPRFDNLTNHHYGCINHWSLEMRIARSEKLWRAKLNSDRKAAKRAFLQDQCGSK